MDGLADQINSASFFRGLFVEREYKNSLKVI